MRHHIHTPTPACTADHFKVQQSRRRFPHTRKHPRRHTKSQHIHVRSITPRRQPRRVMPRRPAHLSPEPTPEGKFHAPSDAAALTVGEGANAHGARKAGSTARNQQIIPEIRDPRIFPPRTGSAPLATKHRATPECHLPNWLVATRPQHCAQLSRVHHSTWRRPQEAPCLGLAFGKSRELSVVPFRAPRSRGTRRWMRSHLRSSRCAANGLGRE